jgi:hypothetical protein
MMQGVAERVASHGFRAAEDLNARLLAARIATRVLEVWCRERGIADGTIVVRRHETAEPEPLDLDSLQALGGDVGSVTFRKVAIKLAGITLVDASNWYFPHRLTPDMRHRLTTDCPFGEAVEALRPQRRTYFVRLARPEEIDGAMPPVHVLEHRALLHLADGTAIAVVHEKYRAVLVG